MYVPPPEVLPDVEYGLQKFAGLGQFKYLQAPPTAIYDGQIRSASPLVLRRLGRSIDDNVLSPPFTARSAGKPFYDVL